MAGRIRTIKPELLDDEKAAGLSDAAWRLFVSSWLLCDDHGRFRAGARYLAAQVWQDTGRTTDAELALAELVRTGRVRVYQVDGDSYAEIPTWSKHQRIDNAGKPRVPPPRNDSEQLQSVSPRTSETRAENREPPLEPPRVAALPPTSDLRPPTNGPTDPSGGSAGPSAPAPRPIEQARQPQSQKPAGTPAPRAPKPESPEAVVWRVWRELYRESFYRRAYTTSPADGKAVKAYVVASVETLRSLDRPVADLEPLARHQLAAYMRDPGRPGFALREHAHGLQWLAHGLPTYGTPWDRSARAGPAAAQREPGIVPPRRPVVRVEAEGEAGEPPPPDEPAERVNVMALFGGGRS